MITKHHTVMPHIVRAIALALALALVFCALTPMHWSAKAESAAVEITLNGDAITADSPGVYAEGSVLTITLPGEYLVKGTLTNGHIIVDCEQTGKVRLILGGVVIHSEDAPALYIKKCSLRMTLELADGTVNELSDGSEYADKQSKADGVIFSKSDLTITGTGALTVKGAYRDGIVSKDDLRIKSGRISVEAAHNGISGKDCVEIYDGEIAVRAGKDGIKTSNDDPAWGYIAIEGGKISIICGDDPLQAVHGLSITGGSVQAIIDASASAE